MDGAGGCDDGQLALILEDDVRFHQDWLAELDKALGELPTDWQMFLLCASPRRTATRLAAAAARSP